MISHKSYGKLDLLSTIELGFLALLVVRSFTEAFSDLVIYIGPTVVNPSVTLVVLMDALGLIYLSALRLRNEWAVDSIGLYFLGWVLCLAPWVYVAAYQWGVAGLTGAREWIRLLSLVLIYLVLFSIARRRGYRRIIHACLLALPIPLMAAYFQLATTPESRPFGMMVNPNNLTAFLVVMTALTIWKLVSSERFQTGILWGGLFLLESFVIIVNNSFNVWLMIGAFLTLFVLLVRGWRFKVTGVLLGAAFIAIFLFLFFQGFRNQDEILRNLETLGYQRPQGSVGGGSLEGRLYTWHELIKVWEQQPLQGYGLNTTHFVNPIVGKAAHNDFVRYLVEGGVFGLLLFVLFQAAIGWELFRLRRQANDPSSHLLAGIGFGVYLAWVIGSIGDNLISMTVFQVYFWALLASISASVATATDLYR